MNLKLTYIPLLFLALSGLLSSCALHVPGQIESSAALNQPNFEVLARVQGQSKATYVFGLGGNNHKALTEEAYQNLLRKFPLNKGEILANVSTDAQIKRRILFRKYVVNVAADVISFNQTKLEERKQDLKKALEVEYSMSPLAGWEEGENAWVQLNNTLEPIVIVEVRNAKIVYRHVGENGSDDLFSKSEKKLFTKVKSEENAAIFGYEVGDKVVYTNRDPRSGDSINLPGTLIAVSLTEVCMELESGELKFTSLKNIEMGSKL